jgi:hypothetical protein
MITLASMIATGRSGASRFRSRADESPRDSVGDPQASYEEEGRPASVLPAVAGRNVFEAGDTPQRPHTRATESSRPGESAGSQASRRVPRRSLSARRPGERIVLLPADLPPSRPDSTMSGVGAAFGAMISAARSIGAAFAPGEGGGLQSLLAAGRDVADGPMTEEERRRARARARLRQAAIMSVAKVTSFDQSPPGTRGADGKPVLMSKSMRTFGSRALIAEDGKGSGAELGGEDEVADLTDPVSSQYYPPPPQRLPVAPSARRVSVGVDGADIGMHAMTNHSTANQVLEATRASHSGVSDDARREARRPSASPALQTPNSSQPSFWDKTSSWNDPRSDMTPKAAAVRPAADGPSVGRWVMERRAHPEPEDHTQRRFSSPVHKPSSEMDSKQHRSSTTDAIRPGGGEERRKSSVAVLSPSSTRARRRSSLVNLSREAHLRANQAHRLLTNATLAFMGADVPMSAMMQQGQPSSPPEEERGEEEEEEYVDVTSGASKSALVSEASPLASVIPARGRRRSRFGLWRRASSGSNNDMSHGIVPGGFSSIRDHDLVALRTVYEKEGYWADGEDDDHVDWGVLCCPCCPSCWGTPARERWEAMSRSGEILSFEPSRGSRARIVPLNAEPAPKEESL